MPTYYPPVGFHFRVEIPGASSQLGDTHFQSVTGLNIEVTTESWKEGGENRFEHSLPTAIKYGNIVLKRGMAVESELTQWCLDAFENFEFRAVDLLIILLNEEHQPLKSWSVKHAFPVKWSVSEFNAEQSALVIESLELKIHYFTLI
ncbi:MAG: phage tail protein [Bacteroidota bacterium]